MTAKCATKGYYLLLDFDEDGWVSIADLCKSVTNFYKTIRKTKETNMNLYMNAIKAIRSKGFNSKSGTVYGPKS